MRFYESHNRTETATVFVGEGVERAYLADMLENVISEISVSDGYIELTFSPFEVKTVLLEK